MKQGAFWNISLEPQLTKLGQLIDINKGNSFQESFGGLRLQVLFNLATCFNYSVTNYVKIPVFHFFEKANKGQLKMENANY